MSPSYKIFIKKVAKSKNKSLKDIYVFLGITRAGFDKYLKSDNVLYSKRIYRIAEFLNCTVPEILGETETDKSTIYNRSISKSNFFSDEKTELAVLRAENEQLKKNIDKQDEEIRFLRGQLMKQ